MGIDCLEVIVEPTDTFIQLQYELNKIDSEYTVIKLPVGMFNFMFDLQNNDFKFVELLSTCHHGPSLPLLNSIQTRLIKSINYSHIDSNDYNFLMQTIYDGLFVTDRISIDPRFNHLQSRNRYIGWIEDEIKKGGKIYKLIFKNEMIGFFILRGTHGNVYYASLGGIFPNFQSGIFGFFLNYFEIFECIKLGGLKIITSFSSNNRGASAIHLSIGYTLAEQYYVFVKHTTY